MEIARLKIKLQIQNFKSQTNSPPAYTFSQIVITYVDSHNQLFSPITFDGTGGQVITKILNFKRFFEILNIEICDLFGACNFGFD
jgi:hypothetical protein